MEKLMTMIKFWSISIDNNSSPNLTLDATLFFLVLHNEKMYNISASTMANTETKAETTKCARMAKRAVCRMSVDFPPILGPVIKRVVAPGLKPVVVFSS